MANKNASAKNYTGILDEVYQRASVSSVLNSPRRMARGPKRQGGHDPEGLGVGPGELHAQRRLQDGLHRVRLQDEGLQLRPRHSAHGRRDGLAGADWRLPSSGFTTTQAFCGCSEALVGGNGTAWSKDAASGAYLRIDREGEPGYLMAGGRFMG
ncbi:MAG: hypothetical protein ACLU37_10640 [Collinsella sp.]